jgi:hypothetical protein
MTGTLACHPVLVHGAHDLAGDGGRVQAALAGDDDVRVRDRHVEPDQRPDRLDPGHRAGVEAAHQPEAEPAGGTRPVLVTDTAAVGEIAFGDVRPGHQPAGEQIDVAGIGALLRAEHPSRVGQAGRDVAQHLDDDPGHLGRPATRRARDPLELAAADLEPGSVGDRSRNPSPLSAPAPPSTVDEPPRPTSTRRAPARSAASMSCPTP